MNILEKIKNANILKNIKVKKIRNILPVFIIYTNWFIPKNYDACQRLMFILVRPANRTNMPLLAHELVHVEQFYATFGFHALVNFINAEYRYESELEAFAMQIKTIDQLGSSGVAKSIFTELSKKIYTDYRLFNYIDRNNLTISDIIVRLQGLSGVIIKED